MLRIRLPRDVTRDLTALKQFVQEHQMNAGVVSSCWEVLATEYAQYALRFRTPTQFSKCRRPRAGEASALYGLYDQSPGCLKYVGELRANARKRLRACPYCGLPGDITLDHYLPRAARHFPHLSILTANLVPACGACQSSKSDYYPKARTRKRPRSNRVLPVRHVAGGKRIEKLRWTGEIGNGRQRQPEPLRILHPYFDDIFGKRALRLRKMAKGMYWLQPAALSLRQQRHVRFHLDKLKMTDRTAVEIKRQLDYIVGCFVIRNINNEPAAQNECFAIWQSARLGRPGGMSIELLVKRAAYEDAELRAELLYKAVNDPPRLEEESAAIDLGL